MLGFNRKSKPVEKSVEMHSLIILDSSGHTEVKFDPADPKAVQEVREQFDAIMAEQRPLAYTMEDGHAGSIVTEFDPEAKETYLTQQLQGG